MLNKGRASEAGATEWPSELSFPVVHCHWDPFSWVVFVCPYSYNVVPVNYCNMLLHNLSLLRVVDGGRRKGGWRILIWNIDWEYFIDWPYYLGIFELSKYCIWNSLTVSVDRNCRIFLQNSKNTCRQVPNPLLLGVGFCGSKTPLQCLQSSPPPPWRNALCRWRWYHVALLVVGHV